MIVKLMNAVRGNDEHPRHGHRIFENVAEVEFLEPERGPSPTQKHPRVAMMMHGADDWVMHILDGNAYVMTDSGKTFSRFEIAGPELIQQGVVA